MSYSLLQAASVLSAEGPFANSIDGFASRSAQQQMAQAVAMALQHGQVLVCEAGTGIGKTFAYLVPAVLSGKKIIISTGTRALQDQLFHRDLPLVKRILAASSHTAMLKGRSNYLCLHRLALAEQEKPLLREELKDLQLIRNWAGKTRQGDIAELSTVPEESRIWWRVTSTQDNCLGQHCPSYAECHVVAARRQAQIADIVVINHHLLFSDMMLRDEGFGELLPEADAFVIDEAHQLPELASQFFGKTLTSRQLIELGNDVLMEYKKEAGDVPGLPEAVLRFHQRVSALMQQFGSGICKRPLSEVKRSALVCDRLDELTAELEYIGRQLELLAERGKGLESCWHRAEAMREKLRLVNEQASHDYISWLETGERSFKLHSTPLDISQPFQSGMLQYQAAWIFSSATLSVAGDFSHYLNKLGLDDVHAESWESPFDYQQQACLYLPQDMPDPSTPDYTDAVIRAAVPVLNITRGRAFLLFTSHRALRRAAQLLPDYHLEFPLLVQGTAPHAELLERFRAYGNAILLGTGSFWEGVDVKGEALSCVIIDKLPFATPDDPVFQARSSLMIEKGQNPFKDYQVPNAVIALRQGVGRLIRDTGDRGVLMICDPRLRTRFYGKTFLHSLPSMKVVRSPAAMSSLFSDNGGAVPVNTTADRVV